MNRKRMILNKIADRAVTLSAVLLMLMMSTVSLWAGSTVRLPGNTRDFAEYIGYPTVEAEKNFLYYLNEILLQEKIVVEEDYIGRAAMRQHHHEFSKVKFHEYNQARRKRISRAKKETFRVRLREIFRRHNQLKKALTEKGQKYPITLDLDMSNKDQALAAAQLLDHIGLVIRKDNTGAFCLAEPLLTWKSYLNHYYYIMGINAWTMGNQINETNRMKLTLEESDIPIPWDMKFFSNITGMALTGDNFLETLVQDKALSALLGIMYRLSDKEIDYIDSLAPNGKIWRRMYLDDAFLMGMYSLCHALRVSDNQLLLPGGKGAHSFWTKMTGFDPLKKGGEFLEKLATMDEGKLNYFYVFSFFLPEETRKAALFNYDAGQFGSLYKILQLSKKEKIGFYTKGAKLPQLSDHNYFIMLYALRIRDGKIFFPGGIDIWAKVLGAKEKNLPSLLTKLAELSNQEEKLKTFLAVYSKFDGRPALMTEEVVRSLYENFGQYNVMVDFLEKIPFKKPGTLLELMTWAKSLSNLDASAADKELYTAIAQSLLELLSNSARYMPVDLDYDGLAQALVDIPLTSPTAFYDGVFHFLETPLGLDFDDATAADRNFMDFLLMGMRNRDVTVLKRRYTLTSGPVMEEIFTSVLESQRTWPIGRLVRINQLLEELENAGTGKTSEASEGQGNPQNKSAGNIRDAASAGDELLSILDRLPHPSIDPNATVNLRRQYNSYSRSRLFKNVKKLIAKSTKKESFKKRRQLISGIKGDSLLRELKHFLVTCSYGVNTKKKDMQLFLNCNLTRYHDFSTQKGHSPWNTSGIVRNVDLLTVYHIEGGLSRLNITLASPMSESIFKKQIGYRPAMTTPIIYNNLDLFPYPSIRRAHQYTGLLVKGARLLIEKATTDKATAQWLKKQLRHVTAGEHYRIVMNRLNACNQPGDSKGSNGLPETTDTKKQPEKPFDKPLGKKLKKTLDQTYRGINKTASENTDDADVKRDAATPPPLSADLTSRELLILGEIIFQDRENPIIAAFLDAFPRKDELKRYRIDMEYRAVQGEMERLGNVYYHTLGRLRASRYNFFPAPVTQLFGSGRLGGEINNQLKLKIAINCYEHNLPPQFMGHLAKRFLRVICELYGQAFNNDYKKVSFLYKIYNYLYQFRMVKDLKRDGITRIR